MAEVTFPEELGGDGSTVSDDANPNTGLAAGGHRLRFVPALGQTVAMAAHAKQRAQQASSDAETTAADRQHVNQQRQAVDSAADQVEQNRQAVADDRQHVNQQRQAVDGAADQVEQDRQATQQAKSEAEAAQQASEQARNESREWATGEGVIDTIGGEDRYSARTEADRAAQEREAAQNAAGAAEQHKQGAQQAEGGANDALAQLNDQAQIAQQAAADAEQHKQGAQQAEGGANDARQAAESAAATSQQAAADAVTAHEEKESAHTPQQVGADPAGTAAQAVADHEAAGNPHPQYARLAEPSDFAHMPTVGGAPIVESDSNSDGAWTRWADGAQISGVRRAESGALDQAYGALIRSPFNRTWNYPQPFTSVRSVVGTVSDGSGTWNHIFGVKTGTPAITQCAYMLISAGDSWSSSGSATVAFVAYGRWK